jgi:hypothetical protein
VFAQDPAQVRLVQDNHVIGARARLMRPLTTKVFIEAIPTFPTPKSGNRLRSPRKQQK